MLGLCAGYECCYGGFIRLLERKGDFGERGGEVGLFLVLIRKKKKGEIERGFDKKTFLFLKTFNVHPGSAV